MGLESNLSTIQPVMGPAIPASPRDRAKINAVAVHLPWIVCLSGRILAEGPPSEVITTEILKLTYGAEMPVIHYEGMTIVAESPHSYVSNGLNNGEKTVPPVHVHEPGGNPEDEASHVGERRFDLAVEAGHVRAHKTDSHGTDSHGTDSKEEAGHV